MVTGLAVGVSWFVLFFVEHLLVLRLAPMESRAGTNNVLILGGFLGIAVTLLLADTLHLLPFTPAELAAAILCGTLLYFGLIVFYMPFYYVVVASLSVRTSVVLSRQPEYTLAAQELFDRFASRQVVNGRLRTMELNGYLRTTASGYALTQKGRLTAYFFNCFIRLWKLDATG